MPTIYVDFGGGLVETLSTARFMSLDLNWKDSRERILQYRVITLCVTNGIGRRLGQSVSQETAADLLLFFI